MTDHLPGRTTNLRPPVVFHAVGAPGRRFACHATHIARHRPLPRLTQAGRADALRDALSAEEQTERDLDRAYWQPLKAELEQLRHAMRTDPRRTNSSR